MAQKLLGIRAGELVDKNWAERFVMRLYELKMDFNRAKDRQRILQEDPEITSAWFKLVTDTKAKYGIYDDDVHNFDEIGFQMGVIDLMKVVTGYPAGRSRMGYGYSEYLRSWVCDPAIYYLQRTRSHLCMV